MAFPETVVAISEVKKPAWLTAMHVLIILTSRNWGEDGWVALWIEWTHCEMDITLLHTLTGTVMVFGPRN